MGCMPKRCADPGLAKNKELRDAMKAEIAKYEGQFRNGDDKEEPKDGGTLKGASFGFGKADEYTSKGYLADGVSGEDFKKAQFEIGERLLNAC